MDPKRGGWQVGRPHVILRGDLAGATLVQGNHDPSWKGSLSCARAGGGGGVPESSFPHAVLPLGWEAAPQTSGLGPGPALGHRHLQT